MRAMEHRWERTQNWLWGSRCCSEMLALLSLEVPHIRVAVLGHTADTVRGWGGTAAAALWAAACRVWSPQLASEHRSPHGHPCHSSRLRGPAEGRKAVGPGHGLLGTPGILNTPLSSVFRLAVQAARSVPKGSQRRAQGPPVLPRAARWKPSGQRRTASCPSPGTAERSRAANRVRAPCAYEQHRAARAGRDGTGTSTSGPGRRGARQGSAARRGGPERGGRDPSGGSE